MSRSINDSITALENARNDIVDALNSKIEGGGIEKTLKISEVAEKINSIEVGGSGGGSGFNWLENVSLKVGGLDYVNMESSFSRTEFTLDSGTTYIVKFTPKEDNILMGCTSYQDPQITPMPEDHMTYFQLTKGTEYTLTDTKGYSYSFFKSDQKTESGIYSNIDSFQFIQN